MAYDNSNSGALFKNLQKEPGDKRPDYKGFAEVNGQKVEVAAWIRTAGEQAKNPGQKFMSLKFQEPQKQQPKDYAENNAPEFDDDIPF